jgi:hypothetical protein
LKWALRQGLPDRRSTTRRALHYVEIQLGNLFS